MTEKQLRRFLQVMVDNLVDSNVFMRSLVLSVEHSSFRQEFNGAVGEGEGSNDDGDEEETAPRLSEGRQGAAGGRGALSAAGDDGDGCGGQSSLEVSTDDAERRGKGGEGGCDDDGDDDGGKGDWLDYDGAEEPCYLGHTWYDVQPQKVVEETEDKHGFPAKSSQDREAKESVAIAAGEQKADGKGEPGRATAAAAAALAAAREAARIRGSGRRARTAAGDEAGGGQQLTRLQCFLKHNTPQLVRDLMCVVNLETINHENICCLNTAVLILIFADRRGQLAEVRDRRPFGREEQHG